MNVHAKYALACVTFMIATAVVCLIRTTPVTMSLFFFVGLPVFGLGALFYLRSLIAFLKSHWV